MKRTRRQYALIAGFAAALTLIGLSEWLNTRIAGRLREAAAAVAHTHEVQTSQGRLLSLLQDIETGARGYVVTGEPAFLEPFDTAIRGVASQFRTLCTLTRDNPIQVEHCKALEGPITERIAEAQASVNLRRASGFEAARERIATRIGKAAMDRIRAVVGRMNAEEETLLGQH